MAVEQTLDYAFPQEHWRRIRTATIRWNAFCVKSDDVPALSAHSPDGQSALNLATARLRHIAGAAWSIKRYLNIELRKDQPMRSAITA